MICATTTATVGADAAPVACCGFNWDAPHHHQAGPRPLSATVRPPLGPVGALRPWSLCRLRGGKRALSVKGRFGVPSATACTPRISV